MYNSISPIALRNIFESAPCNDQRAVHIPAVHIFDMSQVPYMDFAGLTMISRHFSSMPLQRD